MKTKIIYTCQNCGAQSPKWQGKCMDCNAWNSYVEETYQPSKKMAQAGFRELSTPKVVALSEINLAAYPRMKTNLEEFDRVLGGGLVPGSLVLLGGDPGIGKSTLVLQVLDHLAQNGVSVLYVTGEESLEQIKMRATRLQVSSSLFLLAENSLDKIKAHALEIKPQVLVVDSIQTIFSEEVESAPGSVSQVRECAGRIMTLAKGLNIATLLIGHVTKEGYLAGPRVLEHLVDTVLYFEGEQKQNYRLLRTIKNRFGSTNELGLFEMTTLGLTPVNNPSKLFLSDRDHKVSGSTVTASLEGIRPFLVEIQALVASSFLANPRRTTLGVDAGRVAILIAVLEKIIGLDLYTQDIYVNATGGFKITEPAADLAIMGAMVSSTKNKPLDPRTILLGEVGLTGELRPIFGCEIRLNEAHKMGYKRVILPSGNKNVDKIQGLEMVFVKDVEAAIDALFQ